MLALSVALSTLSVTSLLLPGRWWLLALALAIGAIGLGWRCYHSERRGWQRLAGAGAVAVSSGVVLAAVAKVGLTLAAVHQFAAMLGG